MEWVETTQRTVEEAKDYLLDRLGVDEEEADFEVLEEPRPGLFGRTRGQARVRARVRPKAPPAKDDRRRQRSKGRQKSEGGGGRNGRSTGGRGGAEKAPSSAPPRERPTRSGQAASTDARPPRAPRPERSERPASDRGERVPAATLSPVVSEFLEGLVRPFEVDVTVDVEIGEDDAMHASIVGEGLGRLIGPSGRVIDAIQELTRTVVQKAAAGGDTPKLTVDVGDFRSNRRDELERYARTVAEKVRDSGLPHVFEGMGSADRKAIHDAASEVDGLETSSVGDEPHRRVVISSAAPGSGD